MKYIRIITAIIFIMMAQTVNSFGRDRFPAVKEKKVSAHFTVQAGDRLTIDNTYGMIHVNTWDKNEVTIDITVSVKARTEEKAAEILDRVSFKQEGGHRIYFKTVIAPVRTVNDNVGPTIDYVISMPKKMAIDLTNKYGDIYLDDLEGSLQLSLKYGALSAQKISGADNNVQVAYGNGSIGSIEVGSIDISYTNFTIEKSKNLHVKNIFGKLNITAIQDLDINQKYGDLDLGSVGSISGNIDYANVSVDELSVSADLNMKYCTRTEFRSVGAKVKLVKINTSYGNLQLHLVPSTNFSIEAETMYGQLSWPTGVDLREVNSTNYKTDYKGKTGTGSGIMQLSAKYGNIKFK